MNPENFIEIKPLKQPFDKVFTIPGSKSITNRAMIISALADGESTLNNVLFSDDTRYMMDALRQLGIQIDVDEEGKKVVITGSNGEFSIPRDKIYVGNSGTCMRFLTSMLCLGKGEIVMDGNERMRERPIQDLIDGLKHLGTRIESINNDGCPPLKIHADGLDGGVVEMPGDKSSQYFSSILLSAPYARDDIEVKVIGELVSRPYVEMTTKMMQGFGAKVSYKDKNAIEVKNNPKYKGKNYYIESDFSSASYFMAAAALTGSKITLKYLPSNSLQGDSRFIEILRQMGASVKQGEDGIEVEGSGALNAIDTDMFDCSDLVPTVAVLACFARGTTNIKNVKNIRYKETDRLSAISNELKKIGASVVERDDGLEIRGDGVLKGALIETYDDHRIAMSFSLAGMKIDGVRIIDPACVNKTFPSYFEMLKRLY
ncbi:MAG: 3-phosphoshikimate 1-carboxyvinyltransferase [Candidatus Hodarchaeota archaeon]